MPRPLSVAIAGAGIAGLSVAVGLARLGHEISIYERADRIEEFGAGLQIGPNAARALENLGLWRSVEPVTYQPRAIVMRDGTSGATLKTIQLEGSFERRFSKPYRVAHRGDLLAALLTSANATPGIHITTGTEITGYRDGSRPAFTTRSSDTAPADILIGADGIRSAIRGQLTPHRTPRDAGQTIFRALVPQAALAGHPGLDCVTLWMCPGGHVVQYPLPGERHNVVAVCDLPMKASGWNTPATRAEVLRLFPSASAELLGVLHAPETWRKWPGADLPRGNPWGLGNITLIGDAAHATLPYLAQGAAMALEDAATLSSLASTHDGEISDLLRRYESHRHVRATQVTRQSRRVGGVYHLTGFQAKARNLALRALPEHRFLDSIAWIYDWQ